MTTQHIEHVDALSFCIRSVEKDSLYYLTVIERHLIEPVRPIFLPLYFLIHFSLTGLFLFVSLSRLCLIVGRHVQSGNGCRDEQHRPGQGGQQ